MIVIQVDQNPPSLCSHNSCTYSWHSLSLKLSLLSQAPLQTPLDAFKASLENTFDQNRRPDKLFFHKFPSLEWFLANHLIWNLPTTLCRSGWLLDSWCIQVNLVGPTDHVTHSL